MKPWEIEKPTWGFVVDRQVGGIMFMFMHATLYVYIYNIHMLDYKLYLYNI